MDNIIASIKLKLGSKDCRECASFILTRLVFVIMIGSVLGMTSNQVIASHPATILLADTKANIVTMVTNQVKE